MRVPDHDALIEKETQKSMTIKARSSMRFIVALPSVGFGLSGLGSWYHARTARPSWGIDGRGLAAPERRNSYLDVQSILAIPIFDSPCTGIVSIDME